jgi:Phage integrase, N-terminal SAM-like domain
MGAPELVRFLSWLAVDKQVSASTQNQALSAVLFLYKQVLGLDIGPIEHVPRARMPDKLPVVLSREELGQPDYADVAYDRSSLLPTGRRVAPCEVGIIGVSSPAANLGEKGEETCSIGI